MDQYKSTLKDIILFIIVYGIGGVIIGAIIYFVGPLRELLDNIIYGVLAILFLFICGVFSFFSNLFK